jgi:predicted HTH domain antitoxin
MTIERKEGRKEIKRETERKQALAVMVYLDKFVSLIPV